MSTLKVTKTASGKFTWTLYGQRNNAIAQAPDGGFASRQNLLRSLETARHELGAADIQDTTKTRGTAAAGKAAARPVRARVAGSIVSRAKQVKDEAMSAASDAVSAVSTATEKRAPAKKTAGTAAKRTRTAKKAPAAKVAPVVEVAPVPAKRTRARKAAKTPTR